MREKAVKDHQCAKPDEFIDKNYSGGSLDRPDLDRLRDCVALKIYDVIIVYSPDRWTGSLPIRSSSTARSPRAGRVWSMWW